MQEREAGSVSFLNFGDENFDQTVLLAPIQVTRDFWARTLEVALGDLASLVAPRQGDEGPPDRTSQTALEDVNGAP